MTGPARPLPDPIRGALTRLRESLQQLYGDRFKGLYLYGSYARGDFGADSDVDVVVLLQGEVNPARELDRLGNLVADLSLEHDLLISALPVSEQWLNNRQSPLCENIRREGRLLSVYDFLTGISETEVIEVQNLNKKLRRK